MIAIVGAGQGGGESPAPGSAIYSAFKTRLNLNRSNMCVVCE